jgi:hypothetical protein
VTSDGDRYWGHRRPLERGKGGEQWRKLTGATLTAALGRPGPVHGALIIGHLD